MADTALELATRFINSPPGVVAAGGVLATTVWKFFERVEALLTDQTKFEIAVWLVGVDTKKQAQSWPTYFTDAFDRFFGQRHLSIRCLLRSCLVSFCCHILLLLVFGIGGLTNFDRSMLYHAVYWHSIAIIFGFVASYGSLLETRLVLSLMKRVRSLTIQVLLMIADFYLTAVLAMIVGFHGIVGLAIMAVFDDIQTVLFGLLYMVRNFFLDNILFEAPRDILTLRDFFSDWDDDKIFLIPSFFSSIWLWLYAGSGFLLKAARRLDIGFQWFNRKFDIEKKPLQSIGLVAGAVVALVYWGVVILARIAS